MAVEEIFEMSAADALDLLAEEIGAMDSEVVIERSPDRLEYLLPKRAFGVGRKKMTSEGVIDVTDLPGEDGACQVRMTSVDASPWLYRRVSEFIAKRSRTARLAEAARKDSPFSREAMWGIGAEGGMDGMGPIMGGDDAGGGAFSSFKEMFNDKPAGEVAAASAPDDSQAIDAEANPIIDPSADGAWDAAADALTKSTDDA